MLDLPPLAASDSGLWDALLDIADRVPEGWTLIGGQMVLLHALERDRIPPRVSEDLDLVVDVRVRPPVLSTLIRALADLGFANSGGPDGVAHRFLRDDVGVDVLAPDGVGRRTDLRTIGGGVTVAVGGGTFALRRSETIAVRARRRRGRVPRPDLAGAILVKAVAARRDRKRGPERHLRDLAFLLSLADDPILVRHQLGSANCRRVKAVAQLEAREHEAWRAVDDPQARADGLATFALIGTGPARGGGSAGPTIRGR